MAADRSHEASNDAERERLRALLATLSDEALGLPMPADWTVAAVLAHMAFWDARALFWMAKWAQGLEPATPDFETREDVEWINNAAKPLCLALPPRAAAELTLRLAEETDARVKALSDELIEKVLAAGCPFNLSRAEHRGEHLDDIERALRAR
jgi:hypothetical protein